MFPAHGTSESRWTETYCTFERVVVVAKKREPGLKGQRHQPPFWAGSGYGHSCTGEAIPTVPISGVFRRRCIEQGECNRTGKDFPEEILV